MATINQMENVYQNVGSITLTNTVNLRHGLLAQSGTIDATASGNTILFSPATGERFIITNLYLELIDNTGLGGGPLTLSIGTNAPTYNDIMPSTVLTGFTALNSYFPYCASGQSTHIASFGDSVSVNVTVPYTGASVLFTVTFLGMII